MKLLSLLIMLFSFSTFAQFDCQKRYPEMPGTHNMLMFGDPSDQIYLYHLPLFQGQVNGQSGHVLMHVYQALWPVSLDSDTQAGYQLKFTKMANQSKPIPLFSISPRGKRFKVPEMICDSAFDLEAIAVFGHIESNPEFPAPELLKAGLSKLKTGPALIAGRFDQSQVTELSYLMFGKGDHVYMAHKLTGSENSFDQIVKVEVADVGLQKALQSGAPILVTIEKGAIASGVSALDSHNLKKLPISKQIQIRYNQAILGVHVESEVYFNSNDDLKVR